MGRLGALEIVLIILVILLIFGANKLPQLGRAVGDTIKEFRKSMRGDDQGGDSAKKS